MLESPLGVENAARPKHLDIVHHHLLVCFDARSVNHAERQESEGSGLAAGQERPDGIGPRRR